MYTRLAIFLLIGFTLSSCSSNDGPATDFTESRRKIAGTVAEYALTGYSILQSDSRKLSQAGIDFREQPDAQSLYSLREALHACRFTWQLVAPFQFGPAEDVLLRSALNIYPANTDKIESNIETGAYTLGSPANTGAEGFAAVGYLIFGANKSDQEILDSFLSDLSGKRMSYLNEVLDNIAGLSETVYEAWAASGGNYSGEIQSSEVLGTDVGSTLSLLVNAYELYLQRYLRDGKVGIPAGVRSAGVPRPTATEAYYAGRSVEYLVTALNQMQSIYTGDALPNGYSLQDYLADLGFQDIAAEIDLQFDETISKARSLSDPLSEQINSDNEAVLDVFLEIQELVPMIKSDMASAMGVIITNQDADGD